VPGKRGQALESLDGSFSRSSKSAARRDHICPEAGIGWPGECFPLPKITATNIRSNGRLYDQKIETPRLDIRASSHVEGTCEKEKTSGKHRQNSKANCGRDAAKSI
jgi:hypothetical protein